MDTTTRIIEALQSLLDERQAAWERFREEHGVTEDTPDGFDDWGWQTHEVDDSYEGEVSGIMQAIEAVRKVRPEMSISFAGEAWESFQWAVESLIESIPSSFYVRVTPEEGGDPFDAWLVGAKTRDSEWGDEVRIIRVRQDGEIEPDPSHSIEAIRVSDVHIY